MGEGGDGSPPPALIAYFASGPVGTVVGTKGSPAAPTDLVRIARPPPAGRGGTVSDTSTPSFTNTSKPSCHATRCSLDGGSGVGLGGEDCHRDGGCPVLREVRRRRPRGRIAAHADSLRHLGYLHRRGVGSLRKGGGDRRRVSDGNGVCERRVGCREDLEAGAADRLGL